MESYRGLFIVGSIVSAMAILVACGDDGDRKPSGPESGGTSGDAGSSSGGSAGCTGDHCSGPGGDGGHGNCVPTTCSAEGKNCGTISDGCDGELDCGTCENPSDCGLVIHNVCGCSSDAEVLASTPRTARRARSAGFSGTEDQYFALHEVACEEVDDCVQACLDGGGAQDMCDASQCLETAMGTSDCLPAPVWTNLKNIQVGATTVADAVQLTVVFTPYQDALLTDEFKLEVPEAAVVEGITVEVNKAGEFVVDDSVRLVKGGVITGGERATSDTWSSELGWVTYGGPDDLWGEEWSPADLVADDFGLALSVLYTRTVGNTRAYVSQVRVTVHYTLVCEQ